MITGIHISANFAISADGKISTIEHRPSGWTSRADHARLIELRKDCDAIIVGKGTLQNDQMSMIVPSQEKQPLRCVVSRRGEFRGDEKIFHSAGGAIHLLCTEQISQQWPQAHMHSGSLRQFIETLRDRYGVKKLHCEGGGMLFRNLLEDVGIHTLHLTWAAHTLFGGTKAPTLIGDASRPLLTSEHFRLTSADPVAATGEIFLSYEHRSMAQ